MLVALRRVDEFDAAIARGGPAGAKAVAAIAAEQKEKCFVEREQFALGGHPLLAVGIFEHRQRNDVLAHELRPREIGDIVVEHPGIPAGFRRSAAILAGRTLQCDDKEAAAGRQCQPFETLVVLPAGLGVARLRCLRAWSGIVGGVVNLAVAYGQESVRRPDRREHATRRREAIEIRTVFVADEKTAVGQQHEGFGIDADASVRGQRKIRETIGRGTDAVRIESGQRFSRRVGEQDRIGQACDHAVLALRFRHGSRIVERLQGDGKLVEARAIVGRAADVVAAVGQHIERALITCRRSHPGPRIDRNAGAGAEGFTELVPQIGRHPPDSDQSLVDEDKIADRDGLGGEYSRRRRERARDQCRQRDDPQ